MKKKVQVKEQVTKSPTNIEQSLLENFVMLQKVVVKNSESVKELSEKVVTNAQKYNASPGTFSGKLSTLKSTPNSTTFLSISSNQV